MTVLLLAFSQLAEQLGFRERRVDCDPTETPRALLHRLAPAHDFSAVRIAVDEEYRSWDEPIGEASEVALIPPVSGG